MKRWGIIIALIVLAAVPASAEEDAASASAQVWSARQVPGDTVDTIINRNVFVPDQRRAPRVETPDDTGQEDEPEAETVVEATPEDPDRRFRLIGSSFSTGQWIAFIEQADTTEIHRVAVGGPIASGSITAIDYDRIEYEAGGQTRSIQMGRDLTGAEPVAHTPPYPGLGETSSAPTGASSNASTSPPADGASSDAEARRAEILRQLRERRERENQ